MMTRLLVVVLIVLAASAVALLTSPRPVEPETPVAAVDATHAASAGRDHPGYLARAVTAGVLPAVKPNISPDPEPPEEQTHIGRAACTSSWYGQEHAGRTTASGAVFDPAAMTAAHLTLPFGTRVEVRRLDGTGRPVVVTITDRGPAAWTGRCLDLSAGAFERLAPLSVGVVDVEWEVVG